MLATFTFPGTHFEIPPELLLGLVTGLTYSLMGMGLTLVYKSSRVLNFAHGQMGATVAMLVPLLVINHRVNYWVALLAAIVAAVVMGALIETRVIRKLERSPRLVMLVATIGISQLLFVLQAFIPKGRLGESSFPVPFKWSIHVGGVVLGPGDIMILIFAPLLALGLSAFLRRTKVGLASRAAAENIDAAKLAGVPVRRASLAIWIVASVFAAVGTILVGPTRPITEGTIGHDLILRGLAAAMLGGLVSLRLSFLGGIAVGVIEFLVVWNYPTGGVLEVVLFILIAGAFLLRRTLGQAGRGGESSSWSFGGTVRPLDPRILQLPKIKAIRRGALTLVVLGAVFVPTLLNNSQRILFASIVIFGLIGCSLTVLTGYAGQVSLGQFAFVGIGAIVGGRLQQLGYPTGAALVWAIIAGGVAAVIVGLPALRVRGLFLAVTTLAFGLASIYWLVNQQWLVKTIGDRGSLEIHRPHFLGIDFQKPLNYYWLCLAVLVATVLGIRQLRRSGIGRRIVAVRDNEPAAATLSVDPRRAKLTAFVLSGMIASMAGYFFGGLLVQFGARPTIIFGPAESLTVMSMAVIGGVSTLTGVLWGAFLLK
ncbi:MAG: ABC transporter permease, partial [Actinomycetota bacterium]